MSFYTHERVVCPHCVEIRKGQNHSIDLNCTVSNYSGCKVSLYDEEGVEGWRWDGPNGEEYNEVGAWDEPPVIPDALRPAGNK